MIEHIQAVIFDIDGTLVDSMGVWHEIDIEYFGLLGIPMPPTLQKDIEGMSFTETACYFKETFQLAEKTVDDIKLDWIRMAHEKYLYEIKAKPGAKEYMKYLKDQGIKIGVATSNDKTLAKAALEAHGFANKVDSIRTACEVNKGKPAPDIYLLACKELNIEPSEAFAVEDSYNGIRSAAAAGLKTIMIPDMQPFNEEMENLVYGCYDSLIEFKEYLQTI